MGFQVTVCYKLLVVKHLSKGLQISWS